MKPNPEPQQNRHTVLCDADGTLVNTVKLVQQGQYETVQEYFHRFKLPTEIIPPYPQFCEILAAQAGGEITETLTRIILSIWEEAAINLPAPQPNKPALHQIVDEKQDLLAPTFVAPYPDLHLFLREIAAAGAAFAVVTSGTAHHVVRNFSVAIPEIDMENVFKDKETSEAVKLQKFEKRMRSLFNFPQFTVVDSTQTVKHKPQPDAALTALRKLNGTAERSVMVGDHPVDMQMAVNSSIPHRVGVTHGFGSKNQLSDAGATEICDTLKEAAAHITRRILHRIS